MKHLLSCLLIFQCLFCISGLKAQSDGDHATRSLDFKLGYRHSKILDQNTSKSVYLANQPTIGIGWKKDHPQWYTATYLELGRGPLSAEKYPDRQIVFLEEDIYDKLTTTDVAVRGNVTRIKMSYEYLRKLNPGNKFSTYAGAQLSEEANYAQGFVTPGLMNIVSVSPALKINYLGWARSYLHLGITIPIASLVTRSAYHNSVSLPETKKLGGFFKNGTAFESLNQHRDISIYVACYRHLKGNLSGGFEYSFRSLNNRSPRMLGRIDQEFNLTLRYIR